MIFGRSVDLVTTEPTMAMNALTILFLAVWLGAQPDVPFIDLSNAPVKHRLREPTTASASGDMVATLEGRFQVSTLTLELMSIRKTGAGESPSIIAEFEVHNVSKGDVEIPIDPSSADMEPASPTIAYRYTTAYFWLKPESEGNDNTPRARLFLYGARSVPASLHVLKPGSSLRIRARMSASDLLQVDNASGASAPIRMSAFLAFFDEAIAPQPDGKLHVSSEEKFPAVPSAQTLEIHP